MKAALYYQYGSPAVVNVGEIQKPVIDSNEVLIKVHYATVNRTDCGFRSAEYFVTRFFSGLFKPTNPILGTEFSGEIEEVGSAVTLFKKGDWVFGFNEWKFSTHAEYLAMPENGTLAIIPSGFTLAEAAPLMEGANYALTYIRAAKINAQSKILIYGSTGAIGSAGVQLCKYLGAEVTAVCATPYIDLIKSLGADEVIDYKKTDYSNSKNKYDLVFDAVGKSSFQQAGKVLKPNGIYVSTELGAGGENIILALTTPLLRNKKLLFPIPKVTPEIVQYIRKVAEEKKFKPLIDRTYDLDQIQEAYTYVESGMKVGNVLLKIK